jgi:uncharacterized SAM-binding protein YcdF (DUF218 family)
MLDLHGQILPVVKTLVLPPGVLLVAAAAGLLCARRWPRAGRWLTGGAVALLALLSMPVVASALLWLASDAPAVDPQRARQSQAIVILGGGLRRGAIEYGGDTPGRLTLDRTRYGAWLARETGLPVLVSGGSDGRSRTEADVMRQTLEREFGVPVRWTEDRSRNTRENAQRTAEVLLPAGVRRIVLVVHSFDVRRARYEFEQAGFEVLPAPTLVPYFTVHGVLDFMPSASAMLISHYSVYEMLGYVVRRYVG